MKKKRNGAEYDTKIQRSKDGIKEAKREFWKVKGTSEDRVIKLSPGD